MLQPETEKCLNHPKFIQLIRAKSRFSLLFTLVIVLGYGFYILGMSFAPGFMSTPLAPGGSVTYGIVIAVVVILSGMICSGVYTWWANKEFDTLKRDLLKDLGYE